MGTFASGMTSPSGLEFGPDGALWVADYWNDVVKRFDGTTGALLGTRVSQASPFGPHDLVFEPAHQVTVVTPFVVDDIDDTRARRLITPEPTTTLAPLDRNQHPPPPTTPLPHTPAATPHAAPDDHESVDHHRVAPVVPHRRCPTSLWPHSRHVRRRAHQPGVHVVGRAG